MKTLNSFWEAFSWTEMVLIILTGVFFLNTISFLTMIGIRRSRKKRKRKLNEKYGKHVEENLFSIAFDNQTLTNLLEDRFFRRYWKKSSYKKLFLQELIKLHRLYGGEIAFKLQQFYKYSGLMHLSYEKIRNRKWYLKCEGIQELSEMEIQKAAPIIRQLSNSENETLKMVALKEFLHLTGLEGLYLLKNYDQPLNDWIQLNLLESIKGKQISSVPDFKYLLESNNPSLVVFGLRLVSLFQQNQHLEAIHALKKSTNRKVRLEAQRTFDDLSFDTGPLHSETI